MQESHVYVTPGACGDQAAGNTSVIELVSAEQIIAAHKVVVDETWKLMDAGTSFIHKAAECGRLLIAKKAEVGHGNWLPWLAENIKEFGFDTAQDYMKAARYSERAPNLEAHSLRQVLDLSQAARLLEDKPVSGREEREKPPFAIRCVFNKDPLEYDEMEWSSFVESLAPADEKRRQKGWTIQPPQ